MSFTGYDQLMDDIESLEITGVRTKKKFPPTRVSENQCPYQYARIPVANRENSTLGYQQGLKRGTIEIVILVCPIILRENDENLQEAVLLLDAFTTELEENAALLDMDSYTINFEDIVIGGSAPYWSLVARVEVSG